MIRRDQLPPRPHSNQRRRPIRAALLPSMGLVCFLILLAAPAARAKDGITGLVYGNTYWPEGPTQPDGVSKTHPLQNSGALWLTGDLGLTDTITSHATITGTEVDPAIERTDVGFHVDVREAFVERFFRGLSWKVGRQIISWGKSDGINPTDYFSGFDYTLLNPDVEIERKGTDAAVVNYSPDNGRSKFNFTAVYVAMPPRTKILQPSPSQANFFDVTGDESRNRPFKTPEGALKAAYAGRGWDASISTYVGQNHTPIYRATGFDLATQKLTVDQYYQPVSVTGGDFSWSLGDWVLRGESSYTHVLDLNTGDPFIPPDHFDSVLGIEHPIGETIRVGAQLLYRYVPNFIPAQDAKDSTKFPSEVNFAVAYANHLIQGMQSDLEVGQSFRFDYLDPKSGFDVQVFFMHYDERKDYMFRPLITYHWTDSFKTYAGFNGFFGPSNSPFGAYSIYNSGFGGGIYTF